MGQLSNSLVSRQRPKHRRESLLNLWRRASSKKPPSDCEDTSDESQATRNLEGLAASNSHDDFCNLLDGKTKFCKVQEVNDMQPAVYGRQQVKNPVCGDLGGLHTIYGQEKYTQSFCTELGIQPYVCSAVTAEVSASLVRTKPPCMTERGIEAVQSLCERLQRSGGCVVCFARGFIDWRTHKLSVCYRGIATRTDPTWRVWRADHLRVPPGACSSCCIPQNAVGGWHTYQTVSLCVNRCPTPDIVKPIVYCLVCDADLLQVFSGTAMFKAYRQSYEDYAAWLVKKHHPHALSNILEAFLWIVTCRSAQDGFTLD